MLKIIIYGIGKTAEKAIEFIGFNRISAFSVTEKKDSFFLNKKVLSYDEMIDFYASDKDCFIIIASDRYYKEMETNLQRDGVDRYFVFSGEDRYKINEVLPWIDLYGKRIWRTYTEVLAVHELRKYKSIAIYGINKYLPYLIIEIMIQSPDSSVWIVSDEQKGTYLCCNYICMSEIYKMDAVILNMRHDESAIRLETNKLGRAEVIDLYDCERKEKAFCYESIKKYKNMYEGKRCFIVATGPSLSIEDLNCLHSHDEICISMNKIYRCYDKTAWRADYVGISDPKIVADYIKDSKRGEELPSKVFIGDNSIHCELTDYVESAEYYHLIAMNFEPNIPLFSADMSIGAYMGCTVTYDFALQMASYMGFSKIYLIGVDHGMTGKISDAHNHFISNYYREDEKNEDHFNPSKWDAATKAYEAAEKYSREHGFRIYNATRGGNLEVFERVDFENLF